MKPIDQYLKEYGSFHKNKTNIALHLVGIPLIMFTVIGMLDRLVIVDNFALNAPFTAAVFLLAGANLFYLKLNRPLAFVMFPVSMAMYWGAMRVSMPVHIGLFVFAWILQLWGHKIEGKKPAFMQNFLHLLIGPLFIENKIFKFVK